MDERRKELGRRMWVNVGVRGRGEGPQGSAGALGSGSGQPVRQNRDRQIHLLGEPRRVHEHRRAVAIEHWQRRAFDSTERLVRVAILRQVEAICLALGARPNRGALRVERIRYREHGLKRNAPSEQLKRPERDHCREEDRHNCLNGGPPKDAIDRLLEFCVTPALQDAARRAGARHGKAHLQ